ncbi:MAG: hypothetical protein K5681_04080 [Treponema sp.]|nr:hypothetical protein [Treponema sp.]
MVKKILLGLLATAAVIGFAGCKASVEDENKMLSVSGDKCSIDYNNTTDGFSRGWETLKQDHVDAICKITAKINNNAGSGDGVMGYIFNLKQNDDKTYNFSLAGLRFSASKIEYYVSDYKNVDGATLSSGSEFKGTDGKVAGSSGATATLTEHSVNAGIDTLKTMSINNGDEVSVWIDVAAQDHDSTGRDKTKNTYKVSFYDQNPTRTKDGDNLTYSNSITALYTTPDNKLIGMNNPLPNDVAHFSATQGQSKLGFYANVYGNRKLTGTWEIDSASMYHEAEEIEE